MATETTNKYQIGVDQITQSSQGIDTIKDLYKPGSSTGFNYDMQIYAKFLQNQNAMNRSPIFQAMHNTPYGSSVQGVEAVNRGQVNQSIASYTNAGIKSRDERWKIAFGAMEELMKSPDEKKIKTTGNPIVGQVGSTLSTVGGVVAGKGLAG